MYKYCVEIQWFNMRKEINLTKWIPLSEQHYDYVEQRYYKTENEAKKGYNYAVREMRKIIKERKAISNNRYEKYITKRCEKYLQFFGLQDNYTKGPIKDCIWISLIKVSKES